MCIGIPMRVVVAAGPDLGRAICARGDEIHEIDMSLVGDLATGTYVLTFLGAAREVLSQERAREIDGALAAVAAAMNGESFADAFADLVGREPQLPPHLEAARAAGRKTG